MAKCKTNPTAKQRRTMRGSNFSLPWSKASALYKRKHKDEDPTRSGKSKAFSGGYPMNCGKKQAISARQFATKAWKNGNITLADLKLIYKRTQKWGLGPFQDVTCSGRGQKRTCHTKTGAANKGRSARGRRAGSKKHGRALSVSAAKKLYYGQDLYHRTETQANGTAPFRVRVTSAVKRWKRDPNRIEVSVKHGLYGPSFRITNDDRGGPNEKLSDWTLTEWTPKGRRSPGRRADWPFPAQDTLISVSPNMDYSLLGTGMKLNKNKTYFAIPATNQPGWKEKGLVFLLTDHRGNPAKKADLEHAASFLLERGDYTAVGGRSARGRRAEGQVVFSAETRGKKYRIEVRKQFEDLYRIEDFVNDRSQATRVNVPADKVAVEVARKIYYSGQIDNINYKIKTDKLGVGKLLQEAGHSARGRRAAEQITSRYYRSYGAAQEKAMKLKREGKGNIRLDKTPKGWKLSYVERGRGRRAFTRRPRGASPEATPAQLAYDARLARREYEVIVGNIGTVYSGSDGVEAHRTFNEYKYQSESGEGRAAGEDVSFFGDGEPILEHFGQGQPNRGRRAVDETSARELELYIDNSAHLHNRRKPDFIKNALRKVKSGKYSVALAPKLWIYYVDEGAKQYAKEFGGSWHTMFPKETRMHVAQEYAKEFDNELGLHGSWQALADEYGVRGEHGLKNRGRRAWGW